MQEAAKLVEASGVLMTNGALILIDVALSKIFTIFMGPSGRCMPAGHRRNPPFLHKAGPANLPAAMVAKNWRFCGLGSSESQALNMAERIAQAVRALDFKHAGSPEDRMTVSGASQLFLLLTRPIWPHSSSRLTRLFMQRNTRGAIGS